MGSPPGIDGIYTRLVNGLEIPPLTLTDRDYQVGKHHFYWIAILVEKELDDSGVSADVYID